MKLDVLIERTANALRSGRRAARQLLGEVVQSRDECAPEGEAIPVVEFMQFYVGARALRSAIEDGELNEAGDWVAWSLATTIHDGQLQEVDTTRLAQFVSVPAIAHWPGMPQVMTDWLTDFFYYARRRAAMREIGQCIWRFSQAWIHSASSFGLRDEASTLAAMLLGWAAQEYEEAAPALTADVESWATSPATSVRSKATLFLALSTHSGRFSRKAQHVWAYHGLATLHDVLLPHERLQMMIAMLRFHYDDAIFQAALREIDQIPPRQEGTRHTTVAALRKFDAMPDLGLAMSVVPLMRGDIDGVITVLEHWYCSNSRNAHIGRHDTIVLAPFFMTGFVAVAGESLVQSDLDPQAALERLTRAANMFANTSDSVVGADNSALHVPGRFGVPDESHAAEFEAALLEAYCPASITATLSEFVSDGCAQLLLGAKSHPIQSIQLQRLGCTWPIVASLQPPQPDRPVQRVVIWSGAGSLTESFEVEAVHRTFARGGAIVEVHAPETTTTEEFLRVYSDPKIDVLWVVSHGEYDHWAPKNVALQIGRSPMFVNLDHLLGEAPIVERRRLFVLNVCDGGRFEELGALPRIGFAAALSGSHQAVISQMWPVRGLAAAAFGSILAGHLSSGVGFFNAFKSALSEMRCSREELAKRVADSVGHQIALCERIVNSTDDFNNLANSGSVAFFQ